MSSDSQNIIIQREKSYSFNILFDSYVTAMRIHGKLLVLCVFHPDVWGTTAFLSQAPNELVLKGAQTTTCFLSVKDAYKVAAIRDLKEGDVSVKAASKIKNTLPVEIVDENRRVRRPRRPSLHNKKSTFLDLLLKSLNSSYPRLRYRKPWKRALAPSKQRPRSITIL
jgi:hypothetical protein